MRDKNADDKGQPRSLAKPIHGAMCEIEHMPKALSEEASAFVYKRLENLHRRGPQVLPRSLHMQPRAQV
ncbi:hypothetical protein FZ025_02140 [Xanthomonas hyacinthi]|uniref:hypothetical protein n=1 Tax=Xanthomonas hyacinthi TaxID=56455 RepID=UPI000B0ACBF8|nr:hypothetical protein [Xanthomonas hyacinthi]QGY75519.1 hypothetical protein FZ025_02140 [Xanthomonas hyacinthi]